jgi:hypothetical protein
VEKKKKPVTSNRPAIFKTGLPERIVFARGDRGLPTRISLYVPRQNITLSLLILLFPPLSPCESCASFSEEKFSVFQGDRKIFGYGNGKKQPCVRGQAGQKGQFFPRFRQKRYNAGERQVVA